MSILLKNIAELQAVLAGVQGLAGELDRAAEVVADALVKGQKLLLCGNGGSAADAAHLATEFLCRYCDDRRPYPAISLTEMGATLTATGNDYSFEEVFARQVWGLGQAGDVLIVFSTSGRSANIHKALLEGKKRHLKTIAFLGKGGGSCRDVADVQLVVPETVTTARIQEVHLLLYHSLCEMLEGRLAKG